MGEETTGVRTGSVVLGRKVIGDDRGHVWSRRLLAEMDRRQPEAVAAWKGDISWLPEFMRAVRAMEEPGEVFQRGDVVVCVDDSTPMTVMETVGVAVVCDWFEGDVARRGSFPAFALRSLS